jgi:hypothetical protein
MNNTSDSDNDLLPEYNLDYSTGVRGKYYERAMRAKNMVQIDADLLQAFPNAAELNAALRSLVEASKHVRSSVV